MNRPAPSPPSRSPDARLALAARLLAWAGTAVAAFSLGAVAVRAALRLELRWDAWWYHLPFAARRGGLGIPLEPSEYLEPLYQGFPPLPHAIQGALWRLTGTPNATGVVNLGALLLFLLACHRLAGAPFWLTALGALTAPMVLIHAATSYVDLFGNALLATGFVAALALLLGTRPPSRATFLLSCLGFAGAAWSKVLLVPVVALGLTLLGLLVLWRPALARLSRSAAVAAVVATALLGAAPYLDNLLRYGNPIWPIEVPGTSLPHTFKPSAEIGTRQRPAQLATASGPELFVRSLFEVDNRTRYPDRARWIIDQGNADEDFRMGGFWGAGAAVYLAAMALMLLALRGRTGALALGALAAVLALVAVVPQSHELRYFQFIPLVWSATTAMLFAPLRERWPRFSFAWPALVLALFAYMASENANFYRYYRIDYPTAARRWGADGWWSKLERGRTYCAVGLAPLALFLTGPTRSEFKIVERVNLQNCPLDSRIIGPGHAPGATSK